MEPGNELLLIGLSHRTAGVETRERYSIGPADLAANLAKLLELDEVNEAYLLSTCNRTEVVVAAEHAEGLEPVLRSAFFGGVADEELYTYRGVRAVIHVFRVASGLDSLVLGEGQILSQVKQAFEDARRERATGRLLDPLLQQALTVGKRVRTETAVGEGTLSVARVGVEIAERVFGRFDKTRTLVVGAGETALLVARHLVGRGAHKLVFANRTLTHAEAAANELGGRATDLTALAEEIHGADLVLTCVDGAGELIRPGDLDERKLNRRDRPALFIDLSVPRAIHPGVAELDNVIAYDLDHIARVVDENRRDRERAMEGTAEILVGEVHKFLSLRTYASFSPAIAELRRDFGAVREEVLADLEGRSAEEVAKELERRLLDAALSRMKEGARHAQPADALSREYRRFVEGLG